MANSLFYAYANALLGTEVHPDLDTDNIKACLCDDTDVAVDPTTHDYLDDISAGVITDGTSGNMTGASVASGAIDFADFSFTAVDTGDAADTLNFYQDTGVASTSMLIAHFDTATGLPVTPNGADINVALNAGGLFKLVP